MPRARRAEKRFQKVTSRKRGIRSVESRVGESLPPFTRHCPTLLKTPPDEVGHLDEKCATVAAEARLELARNWAVAVKSQIIVIADVKGRARVGRPAQQELPAHAL